MNYGTDTFIVYQSKDVLVAHIDKKGPGEPKGAPVNSGTIGFVNGPMWDIEDGVWVRNDGNARKSLFDEADKETIDKLSRGLDIDRTSIESIGCIHDQLERDIPDNMKGQPHALSCPCPKCSPRY